MNTALEDEKASKKVMEQLLEENKAAYDLQCQKTLNAEKLIDDNSAKEGALLDIKIQRKTEQYAPVEFKGNFYVATERAQNNLGHAVSILNDDEFEWLNVNGKRVILSRADIQAIRLLILERTQKLYFKEAKDIKILNAI
tara:strand:- start:329 stop:748 length:420 start_codon:yes stop_codon:yes gene_type:complete